MTRAGEHGKSSSFSRVASRPKGHTAKAIIYVTKQMSDSREKTDRPAQEVEITPEMIEAGRRELASVDFELTEMDEAVTRVVAAALGARGYASGN